MRKPLLVGKYKNLEFHSIQKENYYMSKHQVVQDFQSRASHIYSNVVNRNRFSLAPNCNVTDVKVG